MAIEQGLRTQDQRSGSKLFAPFDYGIPTQDIPEQGSVSQDNATHLDVGGVVFSLEARLATPRDIMRK